MENLCSFIILLVNSYVLSKVDSKDCLKEIELTKTLILKLGYLYKSEDELLQILNTINDKIKCSKLLSRNETSGLAMIPSLTQYNMPKKSPKILLPDKKRLKY